jgi:hypothetical protein
MASSFLGYIGGDEAISALCEAITKPSLEDGMRKYIAYDLRRHADPRIGPALHTALRLTEEGREPFVVIAKELAWRRYQPATADILAAFGRNKDLYQRCELAEALAALRCEAATPGVRKLAEELRAQPMRDPGPSCTTQALDLPERAQLSLLRFTADWGTPGGPLRYLLVGPESTQLRRPMKLRIYMENIGDESVVIDRHCREHLRIDGLPPPPGPAIRGIIGIIPHVGPGDVFSTTYDLSADITAPGPHTVQYEAGTGKSAVIRFTVWAPES